LRQIERVKKRKVKAMAIDLVHDLINHNSCVAVIACGRAAKRLDALCKSGGICRFNV
jgi:hypothetical protein